MGIDLTPLLKKLGKGGKGKFFLKVSRADGSTAEGEIHECAIRSYDAAGNFIKESKAEIKEGKFGESALKIASDIDGLPPEKEAQGS